MEKDFFLLFTRTDKNFRTDKLLKHWMCVMRNRLNNKCLVTKV